MTNEKKITIFAQALLALSVFMCIIPYYYSPLTNALYGSYLFSTARFFTMAGMLRSIAFLWTDRRAKVKKQHENLPQEERRIREERGLAKADETDWERSFPNFGKTQARSSIVYLCLVLVLVAVFTRYDVAVGSGAFNAWLVWAACAAVNMAGSIYVNSLVKKQGKGNAVLEHQEVQNG